MATSSDASSSSPRIALVTGASRGIGAATARRLAAEGFSVVLAARSEGDLRTITKELTDAGNTAAFVTLDVTSEESVAAAFAFAETTFGAPVGYVFANAGVEHIAPIEDFPEDKLDLIFNVNVKGSWLTGKHALKAFRKSGKGGTIVFTSSVAARMTGAHYGGGGSGFALYAGTKAAVDAIARSFAAYEKEGVKSYAILPAVFGTSMADRAASVMGAPDPTALVGFNPVSDVVGDPAHIGTLITGLFDGSISEYHTGANIVVDNDVYFNASEMSSAMDTEGAWSDIPAEAQRKL